MPRRGGRDRYRTPRQAAKATDYRPIGGWDAPPLDVPLSMHRRGAVVAPADCRHGVPWTTCTTCSTPAARR